jgi:hypothetical protein
MRTVVCVLRIPALSDYVAGNSWTTLTLLAELTPAILLAPFAAWLWWRGSATAPRQGIVKPLILYSVLLTGVIVMWPEGLRQPLCDADKLALRGNPEVHCNARSEVPGLGHQHHDGRGRRRIRPGSITTR